MTTENNKRGFLDEPFPVMLGADLYRPYPRPTQEELDKRPKQEYPPNIVLRERTDLYDLMTVNELKEVLDKLIKQGHGDYGITMEANEYSIPVSRAYLTYINEESLTLS